MVASPGAGDVTNLRIDKLMEHSASTRVEVILLTANLFDTEEARNKAGQ